MTQYPCIAAFENNDFDCY